MKDVALDPRVADATAAVEPLESRQLMAAIADGVLQISGLANASNTIAVGVSEGKVHTVVNGTRQDFRLSGLKAIKIAGGAQADTVIVDPSVKIPVRINTGDGNDHISGGSAGDVIEAGNGDDVIYGNGGADAINAGAGNDRVYGGAGNDAIKTGSGVDKVFGGEGRNLFIGLGSSDRVFGATHLDAMTFAPAKSTGTKAVGNTPSAAPSNVQIASLSLINTDTGQAVSGYENMKGNVSLDLTKLPAHLTVAATLAGGKSTVRFDLDGNQGYRIENSAPYGLGGDMSGKYKAVGFSVGTHTLTASAVVSGKVISSRSVIFAVSKSAKVIKNTPPATTPTTPSTPSTPVTPTTPVDVNAAAPVAAINAISTTIPAGMAVSVDALSSRLKTGDWADGYYNWDFGDPSGSNNTMKGFNASHVYDKAGTYAVTLTVTNAAGKQDSAVMAITVTPANRQVIYVSSRGSDTNDGLTSSTPIKSITKALTLVDDNTEILFRRGETFAMTQGFNIKSDNVLIGAYGSGANPNILWTGTRDNQVMFYVSRGTKNFTAQDLTIDTIFNQDSNDAGTPSAFQMAGTGFTARRCTLLNLQYAFNLNANPVGVMIEGNQAPSETGIRKYFAWVQGTNVTIVGNEAANSTREHIVRVNYVSKINVSNNDFSNISRREIGDYWDYRKTALNVQSGEFAYLYNNKLNASMQVGPLGKGHGGEITKSNRFNFAIAEGNEVIDDQVIINHGAQHVTLRDNVIRSDGMIAINVDGYDSDYQRGVMDLNILNNTGVNTIASGTFLSVWGPVDGIVLTGNVYVAPNLQIGKNSSAVVKIEASAYSSFTKIDDNVWATGASSASYLKKAGINYVGPGYTAPYFKTADEWNALSVVGDDSFQNLTLQQADGYILNGVQVGARKVA